MKWEEKRQKDMKMKCSLNVLQCVAVFMWQAYLVSLARRSTGNRHTARQVLFLYLVLNVILILIPILIESKCNCSCIQSELRASFNLPQCL